MEFKSRLDEPVARWEDNISYYVVYLVGEGRAPSTIRSTISALKYQLLLDGEDLDLNYFLLNIMIKACENEKLMKGQYTLRLPLNEDLLVRTIHAIELLNRDWFSKIMLTAIFVLAYYGLFRIGELVESVHEVRFDGMNVNERSGSCKVMLLSAKNHPRNRGLLVTNIQNKAENALNVGKAVMHYFNLRPKTGPNVPFFITQKKKPVSKDMVRYWLRSALNSLGIRQHQYCTHSFRIGRATDLRKRGWTTARIMQEGRWKSNAVRTYLR